MTYVANISKYYVAYRLVLEDTERRAAVKDALKKPAITQQPTQRQFCNVTQRYCAPDGAAAGSSRIEH